MYDFMTKILFILHCKGWMLNFTPNCMTIPLFWSKHYSFDGPTVWGYCWVLSRWKVDRVSSLVGVPDSNNVSQLCAVLAPPPPWPPCGCVGWSVGGPVSWSVGWPIGGPVGWGPVSGPLGGIVTTAAAATSAVQKLLAPVVTELWSSACVVPKDFVVELGWWPGVRASGWYWGGGLDGVPPVPAAVSVVPILPDQVINIFQVTPPLTSVVRRFTVSVFASIVVHE